MTDDNHIDQPQKRYGYVTYYRRNGNLQNLFVHIFGFSGTKIRFFLLTLPRFEICK